MQYVVILPVQPMTRAVDERLPIHLLFRQVEGGDVHGACGPEKDAVPGLAAFQGGGPAIDGAVMAPWTSAAMTRIAVKRQHSPRHGPWRTSVAVVCCA